MVGTAPSRAGGSASRKPSPNARRFNNNPDQVAQNNLFKEVYGKLEATEVQASEFRMNPLTAVRITPKPTSITPSMEVSKQEFDDAQKLLDEIFPIKNMDKSPPDKYEVPLTASQEYGWCSRPLVKPNKLFNHPLQSCEITQFAASYYSLRRTSPFASKDFVPRSVLKERERAAAAAAAAAAKAEHSSANPIEAAAAAAPH